MKRREFLKCGATLAGAGAVSVITDKSLLAEPVPSVSSTDYNFLTAYEQDSQVWVRWNNHLLTSYRAHPTQKYPYFFPVVGPVSGNSLTSETSQPWPHHRSMFFGCDHVNGGNYWQDDNRTGQIISTDLKLGTCTQRTAEILNECEWRKFGEAPIIHDSRRFKLEVTDSGNYWIDLSFKLTALTDITITKTNHSLFALRAAHDISPDGGGVLLNSEGDQNADGTFGKAAKWCTFYGQRKGLAKEVVEGICIMQYPKPWEDCPWFTRDYGFMSPTPMNFIDKPWTLPQGESISLNYRVVAYAGTPREADLESIWRGYVDGGVAELV